MTEHDEKIELTKQLSHEATDELRNILRQAKPQEPGDRTELNREETFDEPAPSTDPSVFNTPGLESIASDTVVTDNEKEIFFEALLHDTCFSLDIPVFNGTKHISIRSRNVYENRLCFEGVRRRAMEHKDDGTSFDFVLWLQRFAVAIAVTHVFGSSFSDLRFTAPDNSDTPREEDLKTLEDFIANHLYNMPYPKWQVIVNAYMIFTQKEKLLLEGAVNQDFSNPAG